MQAEIARVRPLEDLAKTEKSSSFRLIFNTIRAVSPEQAASTERIYGYMRYLDDLVDENSSIKPVQEILTEETEAMRNGHPTELQQEHLYGAFDIFSEATANEVKKRLARILQGLIVDAKLRHNQIPMSERQLRTRSFVLTWPVLDVFNLAATGKNTIPVRESVDWMHSIVRVDTLGDLHEDLSHGLNLISKEDMQRYGIVFRNGEPIPADRVADYYFGTADEVIRNADKYANIAYRVGLPTWLATIVYMYSKTRRFQFKGPKSLETTIYQAPLDANATRE